MGATIARAIDALLAGLPALAEAAIPRTEVADDLPKRTGESLIVIGRESPQADESSAVSMQYGSLGATRVEESYTIPGFIYTERPGPSPKKARDAAVQLLDVVIGFVHADPTLGGVLLNGRIGQMSQVTLLQGQNAGGTGAQAWCTIPFSLTVQNSYIPN